MYTSTLRLLLAVSIYLLCICPGIAQYDSEVREQIREKIEQLQSFQELELLEDDIAFNLYLPRFYENLEFEPIWRKEESVEQLITAIQASREDGLNPRDYHLETFQNLNFASMDFTPTERGMLDIVLTDALFRLGYNLAYGKADPEKLDPVWNIGGKIREEDPGGLARDAITNGTILELLDHMRPQNRYYDWFKKALREYRDIADAGGWKVIPKGPALKPGDSDERVGLLAGRLVLVRDIPDSAEVSRTEYTGVLVEGVKRFQKRHNLEVDGVVGPATLRALNVPVERRIDQIRLNMERSRWVIHELPKRFILVNIGGFNLLCVNDMRIEWETPVQVGKPYRKTPVFSAEMEYVVFNPTWTVPPSILTKDILPAVRKDEGYLSKKNISVLKLNGEKVDPASIDWANTKRRFPYILRQRPGPSNALGLVKFIFPNKHFVFLHDTPSRSLFQREQRAFSSGCIRVADPLRLADWVLSGKDSRSFEQIEAIVSRKKTRTIYLKETLPVFLLYWTAFPRTSEEFHFHEDIYNRDKSVLEDLDAEFRIRRSIRQDTRERLKATEP